MRRRCESPFRPRRLSLRRRPGDPETQAGRGQHEGQRRENERADPVPTRHLLAPRRVLQDADGCGRFEPHRFGKPEAAAWHGDDGGFGAARFQQLAQGRNRLTDIVVFDDAAGPNRLQQLVPLDQPPMVCNQIEQHVEQPLGKLHAFAVEEERAAHWIQVVSPEEVGALRAFKDIHAVLRLSRTAPDYHGPSPSFYRHCGGKRKPNRLAVSHPSAWHRSKLLRMQR